MTAFAWTAKKVCEALGLPAASWDHAYAGVSTDTRTMQENQLFVALKGERYDGHDFLGDARLAGVGGVVVRQGTPPWPGFDWFEVDDTLEALGRLARYRRGQFTGPVVAVTGTNGKTSTKELIASALGARYRVHKSDGNLNNLVGVPLSVLAAPVESEAMVVECGASVPGEIGRLGTVVAPTIGVVTNVGAGHLEGFGSLDAVLQEKVTLLKGVETAVVGVAPPSLPEAARKVAKRVVTAGLEGADWVPEGLEIPGDGRPRFLVRGAQVELALHGRHMAANAMIALAVAHAAGVPVEAGAPALGASRIPGGRSEVVEVAGITLIDDSYNANPESVRAALGLLEAVRGNRRATVVVGTMRELGAESARYHREAAEAVLSVKPDLIVAVGEFEAAFRGLGDPVPAERFIGGLTPETVALELKGRLKAGDVLLLKASRGVQLEKLVSILWPDLRPAEGR